jgi:hypothetical protein
LDAGDGAEGVCTSLNSFNLQKQEDKSMFRKEDKSFFYCRPLKSARFRQVFLVCLMALLMVALAPLEAKGQGSPKGNPICQMIANKKLQASSGAQMFCFGPQQNGASPNAATLRSPSLSNPSASTNSGGGTFNFSSNVDAADPAEDVTPSGVSVQGQSEVSIASAGPYVVEAWNDGTGFFAPCGSPQNKEELTGFGFSNNGGASFTDLGGLPNANCATSLIEGDPSVEVYEVGGKTYFYISSIFIPFNVPENALSVTACQVVGSGSSAALACSQPIVAAISSDCQTLFGCSFLDKEFLAIDATRGKLYMSYTEFGPSSGFSGVVEVAVCDLSNPASPICHNGSDGSTTGAGASAASYFVVAPGDLNFCENEGSYPAVDPQTGAVYVAYEHNWFTGLFNCGGETTQDVMNYIPSSCLTLTPTSPCAGPAATQAVNITSLEAASISGYNRFPGSDFPRVAVSDAAGTVSMVWNDASRNPLGDIVLQSFSLGSLAAVQAAPVRLNTDSEIGTLHFLPALRNVSTAGLLNVSWYDRRLNPNSALTDVYAATGVDPRITSTPKFNTRVTDFSSDWLAVSSIIFPNFGDYTDNFVVPAPKGGASGGRLFVAWSDGRINVPQPFESGAGLKK